MLVLLVGMDCDYIDEWINVNKKVLSICPLCRCDGDCGFSERAVLSPWWWALVSPVVGVTWALCGASDEERDLDAGRHCLLHVSACSYCIQGTCKTSSLISFSYFTLFALYYWMSLKYNVMKTCKVFSLSSSGQEVPPHRSTGASKGTAKLHLPATADWSAWRSDRQVRAARLRLQQSEKQHLVTCECQTRI